MAGIFGDGQRGGIFGAKVDPRLQAELERRAIEKRQMAQGLEAAAPAASTIGSRAAEWWHNTPLARMADPRTSPLGPAAIARLFADPAGEAERQVETGRQLAEPFTQFNDPQVDPVKQGADLALTVMGGSSVVPAEANSLRMGIKAFHGSPHDAEILASKRAFLYDPPVKSPRLFEEDYKAGARVDEAGNLTHDIEGNPLTARFIAGRRRAGEPDIGLSPADVQAAAEEGFGARMATVRGSEIEGDAGRLVMGRVPETGGQDWRINLNSNLTSKKAERVAAHELAHLIDTLAKEVPTVGIIRQLRQVYNTMSTGTERAKHLTGPESSKYRGEEVPRELIAEAIRAYMQDPNYLKKVAPETAEVIRRAVNKNPELAKVIQFNVGGIPFPMAEGEPAQEEAQAAQRGKLPEKREAAK